MATARLHGGARSQTISLDPEETQLEVNAEAGAPTRTAAISAVKRIEFDSTDFKRLLADFNRPGESSLGAFPGFSQEAELRCQSIGGSVDDEQAKTLHTTGFLHRFLRHSDGIYFDQMLEFLRVGDSLSLVRSTKRVWQDFIGLCRSVSSRTRLSFVKVMGERAASMTRDDHYNWLKKLRKDLEDAKDYQRQVLKEHQRRREYHDSEDDDFVGFPHGCNISADSEEEALFKKADEAVKVLLKRQAEAGAWFERNKERLRRGSVSAVDRVVWREEYFNRRESERIDARIAANASSRISARAVAVAASASAPAAGAAAVGTAYTGAGVGAGALRAGVVGSGTSCRDVEPFKEKRFFLGFYGANGQRTRASSGTDLPRWLTSIGATPLNSSSTATIRSYAVHRSSTSSAAGA
jgi:hypothetical protein